ncbi:MAG TPA: RecQ family ATP-dependent DNA helicase [Solirubrobacterales bacterium]|nr:RecQ family ATP-dependent DNA helicase [Solirubrobacterales bacterium]
MEPASAPETQTHAAEALELLRRLTGNPDAEFRDGQLEAITQIVDERGRVLCVQRTGWGKSAVYFVATALLRAAGSGPTILVSPLIALMRNQLAAAEALGIEAATVNSSNRDDWEETFERIDRGEIDLLLVSPERLANSGFRATVLPELIATSGLLVVDEAHCISDWGHDFRPDYRRIAGLVKQLPDNAAVLCTTATANDRVIADVSEQIDPGEGSELLTIRGTLDRPSLRLEVVELPTQAERLAWLATHLPGMTGSGIVYCLTVRDTITVSNWLDSQGISCEAYSGKVESEERIRIERKLLSNEIKCVVATSALGMGYDKPDLGFVVHFQGPGSPIAYYQQVGRAGRGLAEADAVLLRGAEDRDVQDYFIKSAFPPPEQIEQVMGLIEGSPRPVSVGELMGDVNLGKARLGLMLKQLEVEGALRKVGSKWQRSGRDWTYDEERIRAVTEARRSEQSAMEAYGTDGRCLMQALRVELDDPGAEPCGRCAVCTEPRYDGELDRDLGLRAIAMIRDRAVEIEPRRSTPAETGGFPRIPRDEQLEPGRALSVWNDAGWGRLVRKGKIEDERFDDDLVTAAAALVESWGPEPAPGWVTAVPSRRHPELVPDFAERLAAALGLHYSAALTQTRETKQQNSLANSRLQYLNVGGAFAADRSACKREPVLLIDDTADSRWTLTEAGRVLRRTGVVAVIPLVLASTAVGG